MWGLTGTDFKLLFTVLSRIIEKETPMGIHRSLWVGYASS